jgi:hypothetical protein
MYHNKYNKYKSKYINLKKEIYENNYKEMNITQFIKHEPKFDKNALLSDLSKIKSKLFEANIQLVHLANVRWNKKYDLFDYPWDDIADELCPNEDPSCLDNISFLYYTENELIWAPITGKFTIHCAILAKEKKIISKIFENVFGKSFSRKYNTIKIKLKKLPQ